MQIYYAPKQNDWMSDVGEPRVKPTTEFYTHVYTELRTRRVIAVV